MPSKSKKILVALIFAVMLSITVFNCTGNDEAMRKAGKIARIGKTGEDIKYVEIEWILSLMPQNIRRRYDNKEGRSHVFHDLIRFYLFRNEAFRLGLDKNRGFHVDLEEAVRTRVSEMYQKHITDNILIADSDLISFYKNNKENYLITSGNDDKESEYHEFSDIKQKVLIDYLISQKDKEIQAFAEDNKNLFQRPPRVDVSHVFATSRSIVAQAQKKLDSGESFEEVVSSLSQDTTTAKRAGKLGVYIKGAKIWNIEESDTLFNMLFSLEEGKSSDVIRTSRGYHIFKLNSKKDAFMPNEQELITEAANGYLRHVRDSLSIHYADSLKAWYPVTKSLHLFDSTKLGIQEYYDNNKDEFLSEKRVVSGILVNTWDKGKEISALIKRGADFDSLMEVVSIGENVFGPDFKESFKYLEIGREAFELEKVGDISKAFRTDLGFHIIRLDSIVEGVQKPFEVAKDSAYKRVFINALEQNKNSVLLQVGNVALKVGDYHSRAKIKGEMEEAYYMYENMERIVENSLKDYYYYWDAVKNGFLKDEKVVFIANYVKSSYWASVYEGEYINKYHGLKPEKIKEYYNNNKEKFVDAKGNTLPLDNDLIDEISAKIILNDEVLKESYYSNLERFVSGGRLLDFENVKDNIFNNQKFEKLHKHKIDYYKTLYKEYNVLFFDSDYTPTVLIDESDPEKKPALSPEAIDSLWAAADSALYSGKPSQAMNIYKNIIDEGGRSKKVIDAYINLGRLEQEQGKYGQAYRLFNTVLEKYPKSEKNDRVLFLLGYLFHDKLNRNDLAKNYFQRVVDEYPKSELREDAEVLMDPERLKQIFNM